jgi:signal transduction histidine kinase
VNPVRPFKTSNFQLTVLYAGLFTASILVLFALTYRTAADYAAQDEAEEIDVEFIAIQDEARLAGNGQLPQIIDDHLRQRSGEHAAYLLEDPQGRRLAGNVTARAPLTGAQTLQVPIDGERRELRAHGYRLANGDYVLIGQDPHALRDMKRLIARAFGVNAAITLLLAVIGGLIISHRALRRVEALGRTTQAIVAGDLSRRLPLRGTDDEIDRLSVNVNAMLDRIEDLMRSVRQVSNDIAHDLRTPLTRLRQRLEHARRGADSPQQLRAVLEGAIVQLDSALETFGALLRIAQIEAGGRSLARTAIDISGMLTSLVEDFAPAAADRGQLLAAEVAPGLQLLGDREQLTQMVVNLLDNAVRHSGAGARITVGAILSATALEIVVADTGPGIPAQERENVLRPFYRLETSRTTEGSGLGLSLVAVIAKQHGATLALADNGPGLRVTIRFSRPRTAPRISDAPESSLGDALAQR